MVFDIALHVPEWPVGVVVRGVWLPLLSLFTGARQSELAASRLQT